MRGLNAERVLYQQSKNMSVILEEDLGLYVELVEERLGEEIHVFKPTVI